jgi:hypothetical protein
LIFTTSQHFSITSVFLLGARATLTHEDFFIRGLIMTWQLGMEVVLLTLSLLKEVVIIFYAPG